MNVFGNHRWVKGVLALAGAIALFSLLWTKLFTASGLSDVASPPHTPARPSESGAPSVDLSEQQAASVKVGPVEMREFKVLKTSIGTIDFNENLLVQVFSQYQGKILKAFFNVGDEVKKGDILFTIDSPDLLQAESTLLASAGVLELQRKVLARATGLLKAGGSAQRDVDQATSDEQTAEGNFKSARNAVRSIIAVPPSSGPPGGGSRPSSPGRGHAGRG